jgi:hypothetical protein
LFGDALQQRPNLIDTQHHWQTTLWLRADDLVQPGQLSQGCNAVRAGPPLPDPAAALCPSRFAHFDIRRIYGEWRENSVGKCRTFM